MKIHASKIIFGRLVFKLFIANVATLTLLAIVLASYATIIERREAALLASQGLPLAYCGGSPLSQVVEKVFQVAEGPLGLGTIATLGLLSILASFKTNLFFTGYFTMLAFEMLILKIVVILFFFPVTG